MPPAAQVAFARHFGEVQVHVMTHYHADGFPELYRLSNLDANGKPRASTPTRARWPGTPTARGSVSPARRRSSTARSFPRSGGETHFCDMYGAYERLSADWKRRIANLRAVHNLDFSRTRRHGKDLMTEAQKREAPPVDQPIVRAHPETGRTCLYLGDHAESIVGMPYDEGRALIDELNALAIHPDLTYEHHWTAARADRLGQPLPAAPRHRLRPATSRASCAAAPCWARCRKAWLIRRRPVR